MTGTVYIESAVKDSRTLFLRLHPCNISVTVLSIILTSPLASTTYFCHFSLSNIIHFHTICLFVRISNISLDILWCLLYFILFCIAAYILFLIAGDPTFLLITVNNSSSVPILIPSPAWNSADSACVGLSPAVFEVIKTICQKKWARCTVAPLPSTVLTSWIAANR